MKGAIKAKQGCWTCKRRKIGCDKTVPRCSNCTDTGRECLGYGVRLLWPDHRDGRRKDGDLTVRVPPTDPSQRSPFYGQEFHNVTTDDFGSWAGSPGVSQSLVVSPVIRPARSLTLHPPVLDRDPHLLSYYEQTISTMISTVQARNGFRSELIPMALSQTGPSASALYNAMMAVAAFHNWGAGTALPYKASATRHLVRSLSSDGCRDVSETQAAASMMLCVYNVFDEAEGNWHMHLEGAKTMIQRLWDAGRRPSDFMLTWYFYHEVLGCFTRPCRQDLDSVPMLDLIDSSTIDKSTIVGSLGCSIEILMAIRDINSLRCSPMGSPTGSPMSCEHSNAGDDSESAAQARDRLDESLHTMTQKLAPEELLVTTPLRRTRIMATAELYRLATLLYLQRVCPAPGDETLREAHLDRAFGALDALDVATSPWPVFVLACESHTDERRIRVLRTLDRMDRVRNVGNVLVLRGIIRSLWSQRDLRADGPSRSQLRWWEALSCESAMPWFI